MYRLLIVDNERHVVDGLHELFTNAAHLSLEVYSAYSSEEALNWLERTKMDIVLSDIRMPEMDGLELQKEIVRRWPRCKVIFLSGFSKFDYIQDALRSGAVNYLLKTEGDEVVLETVEKTILDIEQELLRDDQVAKAKAQVNRTMPLLQSNYLLDLLQGNVKDAADLSGQFQELEIPLDSRSGVYMVMGRVDEWDQIYSRYDRTLLLYAIQNIMEECLEPSTRTMTLLYDKSRFVWLIQPKRERSSTPSEMSDGEWSRAIRFVRGTLEYVQNTCKSLLKLSLSLTAASQAVEWPQADGKFEQLKLLSSHGLGIGTELLLIEPDKASPNPEGDESGDYRLRQQLNRIDRLAEYLESGQKVAFFHHFSEIMRSVQLPNKTSEALKLEITYSLTLMFLRYLNKWNLWSELQSKVDLERLTAMERNGSWHETIEYYANVAERIFTQKTAYFEQQEKDVVRQINRYVQLNIGGDLSLTRMGEVVGHSSSYISRLYKNSTGMNLSDYIYELRINKAKEMLGELHYKIQDIAKFLGFENDRYFYRYFKKATRLTPQEYRETLGQ